jgi:hypothetical protein
MQLLGHAERQTAALELLRGIAQVWWRSSRSVY